MKNIKIKYILPAILMLMLGCTDNFDEINTNPNTLTADQLDATMAGPSFANALYKGISNASWSIPGDDYGTYGLITMLHSMMFVHYMSPGWAAQTDANGINDGWRSRGWLRFYTLAVPSLRNAYKASEGNAEALAVLDIWKVYMFHRFTDHWGPVPYSQAGIGGASVPYDSQESMYNDFFNLLDEANKTLSASAESTIAIFKGYDRVYDGDVEKWRRFGNSLRLRLALRISDKEPTKAKTEAEAAVAAGVIESNAGSAFFKTSSDAYNNFVDVARYWGFYMTADMESILIGYNDPRLSVWFSPNLKGTYVGQPSGAGEARDWDTSDSTLCYTNQTETFGDPVAKPIEVMLAAESYFNRAECALKGWAMNDDAQSLYENGISLSLEQWGVTDAATVSSYIAGNSTASVPVIVAGYAPAGYDTTPPVDVPVAWAGNENDQRKQIAVQKYLALFPESWETWSDLRRSDADILYPLFTTLDETVGKGVMNRLTYLPNEYSTNREAVDAAVSTLDGKQDLGSTKVWWDVN